MLLSAIIISNVIFKGHWGRPRPVVVTEFNGPLEFKAWWDPRGACPKNCSFFSGEGATAFWTYAPAALTPPQWRPVAYVAATAFGLATGGLRMAFGGHFFTDVLFSGIASFLVIWLAYALIYRWPSTRLTDYGVDAWMTRLAWPGYRWRQKLRGKDVGETPRIRPGTETRAGRGICPAALADTPEKAPIGGLPMARQSFYRKPVRRDMSVAHPNRLVKPPNEAPRREVR
jgi:hypothetical protein